jgi:hypothetical protein
MASLRIPAPKPDEPDDKLQRPERREGAGDDPGSVPKPSPSPPDTARKTSTTMRPGS